MPSAIFKTSACDSLQEHFTLPSFVTCTLHVTRTLDLIGDLQGDMFRKSLGISALVGAIALSGCGGGGSVSAVGGGGLYGGPPATSPPQQHSNLPIRQAVEGEPAFVNPSNDHTLYFLDVDTPTGGKCTGGCLSVWFPLVPSQGSKVQDGFTIVNRSDGTSTQWDYKDHPLYNYSGDNGPDQANGNGIPFAGGHWHIARPAS
jgi:predicted lipoprotein with Yx(FWY)xxD motif